MTGPSPAILAALGHHRAGRSDQAEQALRRLVQRTPNDPGALAALGALLFELERPDQAVFFLDRAAALAPHDPALHQTRAETLIAARNFPAALAAARLAASLAPDDAPAIMLRGKALEHAGELDAAEADYRRAIKLDPKLAMAHCHLADLLLLTGEPEAAYAAAKNTAPADPTEFLHQATVATFSNYASGLSPAAVRADHDETARRCLAVPRPPVPPYQGTPDPDRPLRVAFLSPDFVDHSVSYFFEPLLEHLPTDLRPYGYFASRKSDGVTARLRARCVGWHTLPAPNEAQVIALLRADRIDVAVDLAGYTNHSLLWTLRQRVCPVQATYLGYPNTTALPHMDARLVDSITDPQGPADALASERLVRLDPCFLCYRLPADAPPLPPPGTPAPARPPTFGSFNLLGKCSAEAIDLWTSILRALPAARLLLKDGSFAHSDARKRTAARFAARGIDPSRLDLLAKAPTRAEHLRLYERVDVALDPFPYNGTTTTCEALAMGVPVVTLAGNMHAGRVGASLLSAVGLPDLVADTPRRYAAVATALVQDTPRLAALRGPGPQGLRARLAASPLGDAPAHARRFAAAVRDLWRGWCATKGQPRG
jgi:predicted O-linked N-acetylglucosamine transferase (SPINDLY family)